MVGVILFLGTVSISAPFGRECAYLVFYRSLGAHPSTSPGYKILSNKFLSARRPLSEILGFHPTHGVPDECSDVLQFELLLDVRPMDVDRFGAQMQFLCNIPGALALPHEPEDLELAVGQFLDGRA